jgi:TDG/mug DNA glycosylase family protein
MLSLSKHEAGHVIPDVLAPNLKVVFCGSAVGPRSAQLRLPYAGPGNKFWPTLHKAGFTPTQWSPADYRKLPDLGYGLTDITKTEFGVDTALTGAGDDPEALRKKIVKYQPAILAFTAKRPAQIFLGRPVAYGFQDETIGRTRFYVLPSPSGRAGSFWDIARWRALAEAARAL